MAVPKDFGNITYDDTNYFYPWKAQAVESIIDGNVEYTDIGNYESFSKALLALISVNTINKKAKAKSLTPSETASTIDYLYYKTLESTKQPYTSVPNKQSPINKYTGNLVIGFGGPSYFTNDQYTDEMDYPQAPPVQVVYPSYPPMPSYIDYNNPLMNLTFKEVFERWYHDKSMEDISIHTMENYRNTYNKVRHLDNIPFVKIKYSQIEECVRLEKTKGNSFSMRKRVKLFFSQLYQWAISHEMCTSNIALNIKLGKNESDFHRKPYTPEQVTTLYQHYEEDGFIEEVLMLMLCGCRIREFLNIRREDIHVDQRYFIVTESKTKAGRNRMVPIHKKVVKFYRKRLRAKSDYLIHDARGRQVEYEVWAKKFKNLMKRFGWEYLTPHSCRHGLVTWLHSVGADPYTARSIAGHVVGDDIHSRVYLHIVLRDIIAAIDLIKF